MKLLSAILILSASTCFLQAETPRFVTGEPTDPKVAEYAAITFSQRLNEPVDMGLNFRNEYGQHVTLEQVADGKPFILAMVYYECPSICNLTLNGLAQTIKTIKPDIGEKFEVITVSFDHEETHVLAKQKKDSYLKDLDREGAAGGWHFLVGEKEQAEALCNQVGFSYQYIEQTEQFAHGAGLVFVTPQGIISRYLPGVVYSKRDVEFSLLAASKGEIGSLATKLFASCFSYNAQTGVYTRVISLTLTALCVLTVIIMAISLFFLIRLDLKHNKPLTAHELEQLKSAQPQGV